VLSLAIPSVSLALAPAALGRLPVQGVPGVSRVSATSDRLPAAELPCPHLQGRRGLLGRLWLRLAAFLVLGMLGSAPQAWDAPRLLSLAAAQGPRTHEQAQALVALVRSLQGQPETARLQAVNRFFNQQLTFREDLEAWGQTDYWASPLESLHKGQGDCEDYAIAKYFTLVAAGVPSVRLRLVYVSAQLAGPQGRALPHMVLAYYPSGQGAEPLIADNLLPEVQPASRRPDLTPVFSFNGDGLWQGAGPQAASGDPVARLSRWREVLDKARAEGFL
jgi:predicted transglutaminase-like cysteine proteinase